MQGAAPTAGRCRLDNSGEGFLSFGRDRLIDPAYSRTCEGLLGGSLAAQVAEEHARLEMILAAGKPRAGCIRVVLGEGM